MDEHMASGQWAEPVFITHHLLASHAELAVGHVRATVVTAGEEKLGDSAHCFEAREFC